LTENLSSTGLRRVHGAVADSGDAMASGCACGSAGTGFVTSPPHPVEQNYAAHSLPDHPIDARDVLLEKRRKNEGVFNR
jgi:hypothetical protein